MGWGLEEVVSRLREEHSQVKEQTCFMWTQWGIGAVRTSGTNSQFKWERTFWSFQCTLNPVYWEPTTTQIKFLPSQSSYEMRQDRPYRESPQKWMLHLELSSARTGCFERCKFPVPGVFKINVWGKCNLVLGESLGQRLLMRFWASPSVAKSSATLNPLIRGEKKGKDQLGS